MALPNSYKKKINLTAPPQNLEYPFMMRSGAAEALKEEITEKNTFLPQGVMHIDLDRGFKEFITKECKVTYNGSVIPVVMMSIQKWNEFTATWQFVDEFENIKIPFISVIRQPDTKPGTHPAIYNIPGHPTFTYAEVPTWDGNRKGVDLYKIPQPTPIDVMYEVRIFAYRQKELNAFNLVMMKMFNARQAYATVNGNPIPLILEEVSDESQVEDLESKRYYVQTYTINLQGFILDPEDFEHVPAINRVFTLIENSKK
jgi:hypothetical protein